MAVKNTSHSKTVTPDRDGSHVPIRKDELSSGAWNVWVEATEVKVL